MSLAARSPTRLSLTAQKSDRPDEVDPVHRVERTDDLVGAAQAQRPQEHRGEELPLAIDPDVEQVLRVVLEFHP